VPVRPARIEDVADIAQIHVRSWQAAYTGLIPQSYEAAGFSLDGAVKDDDSRGFVLREVRYRMLLA
jgi:hypothetical protein